MAVDEDTLAKLIKDPTIERILLYLAQGKPLEVYYDLEHGYHYPDIEAEAGLKPEEATKILADLAALGVLDEKFEFISVGCPRCGSTNIVVIYRCPRCGSPLIKRQGLIEHVPCGYVGVEEELQAEGGLGACPRCGKPLDRESTRMAGVWFICLSCNSRFPEPSHGLMCRVCRHGFTVREAVLESVVEYTLNPDASKLLDRFVFPSHVRVVLEDLGYKVEAGRVVEGKSGVKHLFDFTATGASRPIAIEIANTLKPISEVKIIEWFSRSIDVDMRVIYITPSALTAEAARLTQFYNLTIILVENTFDAQRKLRALLSGEGGEEKERKEAT